jgi:hypothetical protein
VHVGVAAAPLVVSDVFNIWVRFEASQTPIVHLASQTFVRAIRRQQMAFDLSRDLKTVRARFLTLL